ncbi:MAG: acetyltransferase [Magnetovibrio sp.]|nr:acetyltransferase [Magnetovibrio sp.]
MNSKPYIVIGSGGHAKVVVDLLLEMEATIVGLTDVDSQRHGENVLGIDIIGGDDILEKFAPDTVNLALGLGASGDDLCQALKGRKSVALALQEKGYIFPPLVHLDAIVGRGCEIDHGAQIMAGAVVQAGSHVGAFAIVNTRASVDHDCHIGSGAHVSPGVALGGGVSVGEDAYVGIGAAVIHGLNIGNGARIAAGAVVIKNVEHDVRVAGVPAKEMKLC